MVGCSKKGSSQLLCMQPLHILCNNTQNSRPLFCPRGACTAPEKVDGSALLLSGKAVHWSERVFPMRSDWRENKAGLFVLFMQVGSRQAEA